MALDAAPGQRPLAVRFTGSGSEYFRIWIVNLLLSIVTLSLYRPWAKVRRLRYFYANTLVDGHAFDFHGDPLKMLRGYLLVGAMLVSYSVANRFSPVAALVAVGFLAVLGPALLRASLQFRLANTSWRGLRFRFSGSLAGAYAALLPIFVPALMLAALGLDVDRQRPPIWYLKGVGAVLLVTALLAPLAWLRFKRYQHGHYGLGGWQTRLTLGAGRVYGLCLRIVGVGLLSLLVVMVVAGIVTATGAFFAYTGGLDKAALLQHKGALVVAAVVGYLMFYLLLLLVPVPYALARSQNLVWSATGCEEVKFDSHLAFGPLGRLTLKNWALVVLTLGLYYPFAAVATYRLRVESVTPHLAGDLDALQAQAASATDASGDAAGDLFGIDIGL